MIKRITTIRKDQECYNCKTQLYKGSKAIVITDVKGRSITRKYYCFDCERIGE